MDDDAVEFTVCPEPGCASIAEVLDRFPLLSTAGPVEYVRIQCVRRHILMLPAVRCAPGRV